MTMVLIALTVALLLVLVFGFGVVMAASPQQLSACIHVLCSNGNEKFFCGNPQAWDNMITALCGQPNGNSS